MTIGQQIKQARKALGMEQKDVRALLREKGVDVGGTHYSRWETDKIVPNMRTEWPAIEEVLMFKIKIPK